MRKQRFTSIRKTGFRSFILYKLRKKLVQLYGSDVGPLVATAVVDVQGAVSYNRPAGVDDSRFPLVLIPEIRREYWPFGAADDSGWIFILKKHRADFIPRRILRLHRVIDNKPPAVGFYRRRTGASYPRIPVLSRAVLSITAFDCYFAGGQILESLHIINLYVRREAVKNREFAVYLFRKQHPVFVYLSRRRKKNRRRKMPAVIFEVLFVNRGSCNTDEIPPVKHVEGNINRVPDFCHPRVFRAAPTASGGVERGVIAQVFLRVRCASPHARVPRVQMNEHRIGKLLVNMGAICGCGIS